MNSKQIAIELFRVDSTSKYIDLVFNIPGDFHMVSLALKVIGYVNGKETEVEYQLSEAMDFAGNKAKKDWVVRIPVSLLGIDYPAMYHAVLKMQNDDGEEVGTELLCSDTNYVYLCLLSDLTENCDVCAQNDPVSDTVIRNYLILYGHHAAMALKDIPTAMEYFRLLSNCFNNCGKNEKLNDCGCAK